MITEVLPNFYQLQVPFPKNPLRNINCYVIKDNGRALMVDTGVNLDETRSAVLAGINEINVDLSRTDFFITHMHTDHIGLLARLVTPASKVYFNQPETNYLNYNISQSWEQRVRVSTRNGFPERDLLAAGNHPMFRFREWTNHEFCFVSDGDVITIGDYNFQCIHTPGHSRGHTCLYEPDKKIMLSGDHILGDISPNISTWSPDENPLLNYLESLDKVFKLEVGLVLPGHRKPFNDMRGRIDELRHHHEIRANEVLHILKQGKQNAYQVASRMTWDLTYSSWDTVPVWQRMFAMGEALAHLKYLEFEGKVREERGEQKIVYSLVQGLPSSGSRLP